MKIPRAQFEKLAEDALTRVPKRFLDLLVNLEITVKASPGREAGRWAKSKALLGLYNGLDRQQMLSPFSGSHPPARIFLYQENIEAGSQNLPELKENVALTLRHELAHHFGFTDEDLKKKWPQGA